MLPVLAQDIMLAQTLYWLSEFIRYRCWASKNPSTCNMHAACPGRDSTFDNKGSLQQEIEHRCVCILVEHYLHLVPKLRRRRVSIGGQDVLKTLLTAILCGVDDAGLVAIRS